MQSSPACFIITSYDDLLLLNREREAFEAGGSGFEDSGIEAIVVLDGASVAWRRMAL